MVVIEPTLDGFVVRDPLPGVTYPIDAAWIGQYVESGVFNES